MRSKMFVPTLCVTLIAGLATGSIHAQGTGPVTFKVIADGLSGTVVCNGETPTPIAPVDPSTSSGNGGLNDVSVSDASANACGLPLYAIQSAQDASYTTDTATSDVGNGGGELEQVSLLGGLLKYQAKAEYDLCGASASGNTATINCQDTTQLQNLVFAGQSIAGTSTQPQTVDVVNAQVQLSGYCTGIALFTGQLTLNAVSQQQNGNSGTITIAPIAINGTLTCAGLPLTSMTISLRDATSIEYQTLPGLAAVIVTGVLNTISQNPVLFNLLTLTNPNQ